MPISVAATYKFSPSQLSTHLRDHFNNTQNFIIRILTTDDGIKFNRLPLWMGDLMKLKRLAIWNADLSGFRMCNGLSLTYLDLRQVRYTDSLSLVEIICGFKELELMICDASVSADVVSSLKERLPDLVVVKKGQ